jgi:hypothetical protein
LRGGARAARRRRQLRRRRARQRGGLEARALGDAAQRQRHQQRAAQIHLIQHLRGG